MSSKRVSLRPLIRLLATAALLGSAVAVGAAPASASTACTVYVANTYDGSVSVIDGVTNSVTATIPVGAGPFGVAACPSTPPPGPTPEPPGPAPVPPAFTG